MEHNNIDVEATVIGDKERAMFALIEQNKQQAALIDAQQQLIDLAGKVLDDVRICLEKAKAEAQNLLKIVQKISGEE